MNSYLILEFSGTQIYSHSILEQIRISRVSICIRVSLNRSCTYCWYRKMIILNNKILILNINFIKNRLNTIVISILKLTLVHNLTAWLLYHENFCSGPSVLVLETLIRIFCLTLVRLIWIHVQYCRWGSRGVTYISYLPRYPCVCTAWGERREILAIKLVLYINSLILDTRYSILEISLEYYGKILDTRVSKYSSNTRHSVLEFQKLE